MFFSQQGTNLLAGHSVQSDVLKAEQNKGYFLGFLFKPRGGLPRGLNKKAEEKYPLFMTYITKGVLAVH